jgi:hypothetical protein
MLNRLKDEILWISLFISSSQRDSSTRKTTHDIKQHKTQLKLIINTVNSWRREELKVTHRQDQYNSNQIKSNQIKSNQIKSNHQYLLCHQQ